MYTVALLLRISVCKIGSTAIILTVQCNAPHKTAAVKLRWFAALRTLFDPPPTYAPANRALSITLLRGVAYLCAQHDIIFQPVMP